MLMDLKRRGFMSVCAPRIVSGCSLARSSSLSVVSVNVLAEQSVAAAKLRPSRRRLEARKERGATSPPRGVLLHLATPHVNLVSHFRAD